MFRAKNSPILRSTLFDCIYSFWYNAPAPVANSVDIVYQKLCIQLKRVLLKMG